MPAVLGTARPAAHLFDKTGVTWIADLVNARNIQWQAELSRPGTASFEVPLVDAGAIGDHSVVKFSYHGAIRFGCVIRSEAVAAAVDGTTWIKYDTQPGLLSLLNEAVVYPENGLSRRSPATRAFGYMSVDGPWRVTSEWVAPQAMVWGIGHHHSKPAEFATLDPTANWIAYTNPNTTVSVNTINYFRASFTLAAAQDLQLMCAGDNFAEVYLDGECIVAADRLNIAGWRTATQVSTRLAAGTHLLAAKVENSPFTSSEFGGANPIGFILSVLPVDTNGDPIPNTPILHTDTTNWLVSDGVPEPGWSRAWVLGKLVAEARTRGVRGPLLLDPDFTDALDSDGVAFTDRGEYAIDVATTGLADVVAQLCEADIDVDVDPATMTLQCFNRKGADRHATVALQLGKDGGYLKAYDTTRSAARFTSVLTQLANGTWLATQDTAGLAATGLVEVGLNIGSTNSVVTAANIARSQLAESAQSLVSFVGEPSTLGGPVAYVDYGLGDSIAVPGHRGVGVIKARVLSITVDASAEPVRAWPEFVQDNS